MYDAIWTTGELGVTDPKTGRLKSTLPTIEDMARFYQRVTGVKAADFVAASKSFGVDLKIRQAESQIIAMQVAEHADAGGERQVPPEQREPEGRRRDDRAGEVPGGDGNRGREACHRARQEVR